MFERIACGASRRMAVYLNWNEVEEAEFYLGMKVLLHNIRTIVGIVLLSLFMGVFRQTCAVFLAFGFLRLKAGGFHCKESWQCFSLTSLIVIGGAFAADVMGNMRVTHIVVGYAILCLEAYMIAPRETKNHPISPEMQKKKKCETMIYLVIYMVLTILLKDTAGKFIMMGAILEMISLIPSVS